jgi:hypothetical protein
MFNKTSQNKARIKMKPAFTDEVSSPENMQQK